MSSVYIEILYICMYVAKVSFEHQVYGYLLILQIVLVLIDGCNRVERALRGGMLQCSSAGIQQICRPNAEK